MPTRALDGLIVFSITPLREDETVDEPRLQSHLDDLIAQGADGIALFGSTGAIGSFSEAERKRVAEVGIAHVAGRVPVMVGTGAISTAEAVRLSAHAQGCGAAAVLVVPISYWLLTEAELLAHYAAIDAAVSIPMALYNNPRLTGNDLVPGLVARLCELPNVRYLKESAPDVRRVSEVKRLVGDRLKVFAGRDDSVLEALALGADAWASGCANFMTRSCRDLLHAVEGGNATEVERPLHRLIEFAMSKGLVRTCHEALSIMGRPAGAPRRPILPLSPADRARLSALIAESRSIHP